MSLKSMWNELISDNQLDEGLDRNIYSDKEAFLDSHKNSSQMVLQRDLEDTAIYYDPFSGYSNNMIQNASAGVLSYNDFVRRWREVANLPEVDQALQEITSEAIVFDELDDVVSINLDDIELPETIKTKIKDSFDKILYLLDFNEKGEELFRQWYVDATLNIECVYNNRKPKDGIQKLILLPPFNIFKFKSEKDGKVRWYINSKATYNVLKDLQDAEKSYVDEQITQINSGLLSPDKKYYQSYLQKAVKTINQLYLLEDSLVVMRMTKSTEKRVFYIDTGNLPKSKAEEYMKNLIQKYRQKKVYNTELGTIENKNKTISVLEDFWFPVSNGKSTRVENLPGIANNFTSFDDINYFVDKVYACLMVPQTRRNKESRVSINSNIDIERDEMQFYKFILKLRRRFNNMFVDLLKKDVLAKQIMGLTDWNKIQEKIKFTYAESNEISLIKKMQINQIKMDAATAAMTLVDTGILSRKYIQTEILKLTNEEIEEINSDNSGGGVAGETDALGNITGTETGGGETPGYEEVGGETPTEETPEEPKEEVPKEKPKKGERFKQRQKEGLNQDILDQLQEGDVITDGKNKLLFKDGKLEKI